MTQPSRIGHHRAKYQQMLDRHPHANLGKPLTDLDWWISDAQKSLSRMEAENSAPDMVANLRDHIADLEDARVFLRQYADTQTS